MKLNYLYILILLSSMVTGCKKDQPTPDFNQQLHGKYVVLSAETDKKIDVNFDGVENSDMLDEISDLKQSYLELIIRRRTETGIFGQFWPNQAVYTTDGIKPTAYDPKAFLMYVNQATVASFKVNQNKSALILIREKLDPSFPLPKSVEILKNQDIRITMSKSLYTSTGWQEVNLKVIYHKFTDQF